MAKTNSYLIKLFTGKCSLTLIDCVLTNFATAICCYANALVTLQGSTVINCGTAIECNADSVTLNFNGATSILNSTICGISIVSTMTDGESSSTDMKSVFESIEDVE